VSRVDVILTYAGGVENLAATHRDTIALNDESLSFVRLYFQVEPSPLSNVILAVLETFCISNEVIIPLWRARPRPLVFIFSLPLAFGM